MKKIIIVMIILIMIPTSVYASVTYTETRSKGDTPEYIDSRTTMSAADFDQNRLDHNYIAVYTTVTGKANTNTGIAFQGKRSTYTYRWFGSFMPSHHDGTHWIIEGSFWHVYTKAEWAVSGNNANYIWCLPPSSSYYSYTVSATVIFSDTIPEEPGLKKPYSLIITNYAETLIKSTGFLYDLLYQDCPFDPGFRYFFTFTTKDEDGNNVFGEITPIPVSDFRIEKLVFGWPPRQFLPIEPFPHIEWFTNIYFVGAGQGGEARSSMSFMFIPYDDDYNVEIFVFNMNEFRASIDVSNDYTEWEGLRGGMPHNEWYGKTILSPVGSDRTQFNHLRSLLDRNTWDSDIGGFDDDWIDANIDDITEIGATDITAGDNISRVGDVIMKRVDLIRGKAPFAYFIMVLDSLDNFKDSMGTGSVPDIQFDTGSSMLGSITLSFSEYTSIFTLIRNISTVLIYMLLVSFFYAEYRSFTGGGA